MVLHTDTEILAKWPAASRNTEVVGYHALCVGGLSVKVLCVHICG